MRCVLHIGTPKTATTLIQQWLYENEIPLSEQGVALTKSGGRPNNRKFVSYFQGVIDDFMRAQNVTNLDERERYFEAFEAALAKELEKKSKNHDTVLFTSEHLHSRLTSANQIQELKKFLDKFFNEYKIICYFREQGAVRQSLYSTGLKAGVTDELADFHANLKLDDPYYNYHQSFALWEDAFGIDALQPRLFDKSKIVEGDIRKDFLKFAFPEIDPGSLSFQTTSANESLSRSTARVFQTINTIRPQYVGRSQDPVPIFFKNLVANTSYLDSGQPLNDTRRTEIYDRFNDSNIAFFKRYFGENRNLFKQPALTVSEHKELTVSEDEFIQFISQVLGSDQVVVIPPKEVNFLRDLAIRLYDSKSITSDEAITLLKIGNRARPGGKMMISKIEEFSGVGRKRSNTQKSKMNAFAYLKRLLRHRR